MGADPNSATLESLRFRFEALRETGEKMLAQVGGLDLHWLISPDSNSIATIIQHLHGNMISRWTNFLISDGEKESRDRDGEFTPNTDLTHAEALRLWKEGWKCVLSAIDDLKPEDLTREVMIRGQTLTVVDAIVRQVSHCSYHVGQMVLLARIRKGEKWKTISIARGQSKRYRPKKRD